MARFWPEPAPSTSSSSTAILLVNLGTPAAPTAAAVRPYLAEFLADPRVVEIPALIWRPILHGFILRRRPSASAAKYASIWGDEGSPLLHYTGRQAELLAKTFEPRYGERLVVDFAMRYGQPSIANKLQALRARGCSRILILPLYPQYAASTTATVVDEVGRCLTRMRNQPELRFVRSFADDEGYLDALASQIKAHWAEHGVGERLVMSFHGIPRRSVELGDPYQQECLLTGRRLAERLALPAEQVLVTFQSRFGKAEWLQPYTQPTIEQLARNGIRHINVLCPGFVADCLETLEEIDMECRTAFLSQGGKTFHYIPCLNDSPAWIDALAKLAQHQLSGWL